ncbi:hypothetical protein C8R45DRAFT_1158032 [Mycena sanguinolenta]|nr:hypothetical protein C8R45DRAFT_1158032 [Mycena sanguinolenta]
MPVVFQNGKVMRHIQVLEKSKVPPDEEFHFGARAKALVDRWDDILDSGALVWSTPHARKVALSAALVNTTFDDSCSNFTFTGSWVTITPSNPCAGCETKPDPSQIRDGTWHDGSIHSSGELPSTGSFTFQGSAVYIFGIDQNLIEADIVFTLGEIQKTHHYTGPGTITNSGFDQFVYNALFFSATGLPSDQTQTVSWVLNLADTGAGLQIGLFDYAIVTTDEDDALDPPPTTHTTPVQPNQATTQGNNNSPNTSTGSSNTITTPAPSSSTSGIFGPTTVEAGIGAARSSKPKFDVGAIAGVVVGAVVVIALAVLFVWYQLRRARRIKPDTTVRSQFHGVADYPILVCSKASMAGISLLKPQNDHTASAPTAPSSAVLDSPSPIVTATATSRDMQMEERLAALEAQMAVQQQPPPYLHEDDH